MGTDATLTPPLPEDLESAHIEIRRLRNQLLETNQRLAKCAIQRHLNRKAYSGSLKKLEADLKQAKSQARTSKGE